MYRASLLRHLRERLFNVLESVVLFIAVQSRHLRDEIDAPVHCGLNHIANGKKCEALISAEYLLLKILQHMPLWA